MNWSSFTTQLWVFHRWSDLWLMFTLVTVATVTCVHLCGSEAISPSPVTRVRPAHSTNVRTRVIQSRANRTSLASIHVLHVIFSSMWAAFILLFLSNPKLNRQKRVWTWRMHCLSFIRSQVMCTQYWAGWRVSGYFLYRWRGQPIIRASAYSILKCSSKLN